MQVNRILVKEEFFFHLLKSCCYDGGSCEQFGSVLGLYILNMSYDFPKEVIEVGHSLSKDWHGTDIS